MIRKTNCNSIIYALLILLATFLLPAKASAQKILRYTDHEPLGNMRTRFINDVFFTAIEKESNGRLKIEAHWNGELSTSYDALRTVKDGNIADIAIVVPEYASNALPLHQIFKSFPVGPTGDKQVEFFQRVYEEIPAFQEELEKENVMNILFATGYPVAFFSTTPLSTLDDISGKKWRSASFWHKSFLQNAGAIPVTMPWGEGVRKALEDGTLNGLMVNIDSGDDIKAQQAAPYVLASSDLWLGHVYIVAINKTTWNTFSKEDKEAIGRVAATAYRSLGAVMNSSFETLVENLRKDNINIRLLEPEEVKQWETVTKYREAQAAWVKEQESKGMKNIGAILEKVNAIMDDVMK